MNLKEVICASLPLQMDVLSGATEDANAGLLLLRRGRSWCSGRVIS